MPTSLNVIKFHYIGVMEDGGDTVRLVADGEESYIQTYNTVTPLYRKIGNNGRIIYVATFDTRSYMFYMIDCESLMVSHIAKISTFLQ